MIINWTLVIVLIGLGLPGVLIAIPRLIHLLLPHNTEELKTRISRLVVVQTLIMLSLMSLAGAVLSQKTGLNDPIIEGLLQGKPFFAKVQDSLLPVFLATLLGLGVFLLLYYKLVSNWLDEKTLTTMYNIRAALRLDGCILYGGVVEEILARWGLMNLIVFFSALFVGTINQLVIWVAILISGLMISLGHLPAYLAAGCTNNRKFIYSMLLLSIWQTVLFGWIFWHYGLLAAIVSHILFHIGWYSYHRA